ncbi:hypothetical protein [Pseudomonas sp. RIT-PI-S]|uniref:hypothetical protein n=1 Tax=Pseudomonas sp. RIT-PI-S TaxID=3035295 RepID=UPI0021D815CA|nr:hypothetical protein [Pseudomonas sp. RIT-PI-S]
MNTPTCLRHLSEVRRNLAGRLVDLPTSTREEVAADVKALGHNLDEIESIRNSLSAIEGTMQLILQLLNSAESSLLPAPPLHQLLSLVQGRFSQSLTKLDEVL